jgi:hypothetical protein
LETDGYPNQVRMADFPNQPWISNPRRRMEQTAWSISPAPHPFIRYAAQPPSADQPFLHHSNL